MLRLAIAVERPQRLCSLLKNSIRCFVFGWRSGSPLRSASSFLVLALAAAGDCGAHEKFFSKPQKPQSRNTVIAELKHCATQESATTCGQSRARHPPV